MRVKYAKPVDDTHPPRIALIAETAEDEAVLSQIVNRSVWTGGTTTDEFVRCDVLLVGKSE